MRIQLVRTLQGGEKLAGPVITKENEILISEGTTLKTEYLDLISFLGIETLCIEDPYEVRTYTCSNKIMYYSRKKNEAHCGADLQTCTGSIAA